MKQIPGEVLICSPGFSRITLCKIDHSFTDSVGPTPLMSILRLKFAPRLAFFEQPQEADQDIDQIDEKPFPTGDPELDKLILPGLANDLIDFKYVLEGSPLKGSNYRYDPQENVIELWAKKSNGTPITAPELSQILYDINPNGGAPDTWMEGNIEIVDEETANLLGYGAIELHPHISYVGVLYPDGQGTYVEHPVNLGELPPHT